MDTPEVQAVKERIQPFTPWLERLASLLVRQEKSVDSFVIHGINRGKSTMINLIQEAFGG